MSDDEIIAVVQAHKEGKEIEWRERSAPQLGWINLKKSTSAGWFGWDFKNCDYRVTPEPREWWVQIKNGEITSCLSRHIDSDSDIPIRVREVIEEDNRSTVQRMMEHATGFKND